MTPSSFPSRNSLKWGTITKGKNLLNLCKKSQKTKNYLREKKILHMKARILWLSNKNNSHNHDSANKIYWFTHTSKKNVQLVSYRYMEIELEKDRKKEAKHSCP